MVAVNPKGRPIVDLIYNESKKRADGKTEDENLEMIERLSLLSDRLVNNGFSGMSDEEMHILGQSAIIGLEIVIDSILEKINEGN